MRKPGPQVTGIRVGGVLGVVTGIRGLRLLAAEPAPQQHAGAAQLTGYVLPGAVAFSPARGAVRSDRLENLAPTGVVLVHPCE